MSTGPLLVDIAGECWAIDVPPAWRPRYEAAFRHVHAPDASLPALRVRCRESPDPEEAAWARSVSAALADDDGIAAVRGPRGRAHVSRMSMETFDEVACRGESVLLDPAFESKYLGTNLLLAQVAWRSQARGLVPVHGAAIGLDGRFWLVPAAAGRGKSTLTAAALASGLDVLADDFLLLDHSRLVLHGLYATVRLAPSAHRMVTSAFGDGALEVLAAREDDKLLLTPRRPAADGAGRFVRGGSLAGIALLARGERAAIGGAASPGEALAAFASTLRLAPTLGFPAPTAFAAFRTATARVPARVLHTCPDLHAVVAAVRGLLEGTP